MQEFALEHPWMVFIVAVVIAGGVVDFLRGRRVRVIVNSSRCKQHVEGD